MDTPKITVHRTHIEIHDYNVGDCLSLERTFSIYNKNYFRYEPKAIWYEKETRTLMLPRRTSIERLEKIFNTIAVVDYSSDQFRDISPIGLKYAPRDDDQKEAIKFILGIDNYRDNIRKSMLALNLNTGKGKSYCAIASMAYMGIASAIITASTGLLKQWKDFIMEYTDIEEKDICIVTGTPTIQKILRWPPDSYKVFLFSHGTLSSYGNNYGWKRVGELFKYLGIGIKFYDECHQHFDNMCMIDFYTNTHTTLYLTATLARSDFNENEIFKLYFNGVPSIDLFKEDKDPHTKYVGIKYNSHPSPMQLHQCQSNYGIDRNAYTDYLVKQPNFEKILRILIDKALAKPGKCLWYIGTNNSILYVRDWIYKNYPELVGAVGIYTSIVPPEVKQSQLDKKIILSTTKSAGAAMDIKGLVETVNLAEPFKSRVLAQQTLGRTRASDTIYKDIVDVSFPQMRKFYAFKKPVFTKYATECNEVVLRDEVLDQHYEKIMAEREKAVFPITFIDDREEWDTK